MGSKPSTPCKELFPWLRENVGASAMGALTGTDAAALKAAVHVLGLMAYIPTADADALRAAFKAVVDCMQPSTQWAAFHAIAYVFDWSTRDELWQACDLGEGKRPSPLPLCEHEPGGSQGRVAP